MSKRNFRELLEEQWSRYNFLCVGLDSDYSEIPESMRLNSIGQARSIAETIYAFNKAIVDQTKDLVCAYKLNCAFYEMHGEEGVTALRLTIEYIRAVAPDVPVILDAKRADIGNTNTGYAKAAFDYFDADAVTVSPHLGGEALQPFLERKEKGVFVLCRTSNPGAGEFQDKLVLPDYIEAREWELQYQTHVGDFEGRPSQCDPMPLYQYVAYRVSREWNKNGNCALVVGATRPGELRKVREVVDDMPILILGIGAQGGNLKEAVAAGKGSHGKGIIISASRSIIFSKNPRAETAKAHELINQYR